MNFRNISETKYANFSINCFDGVLIIKNNSAIASIIKFSNFLIDIELYNNKCKMKILGLLFPMCAFIFSADARISRSLHNCKTKQQNTNQGKAVDHHNGPYHKRWTS